MRRLLFFGGLVFTVVFVVLGVAWSQRERYRVQSLAYAPNVAEEVRQVYFSSARSRFEVDAVDKDCRLIVVADMEQNRFRTLVLKDGQPIYEIKLENGLIEEVNHRTGKATEYPAEGGGTDELRVKAGMTDEELCLFGRWRWTIHQLTPLLLQDYVNPIRAGRWIGRNEEGCDVVVRDYRNQEGTLWKTERYCVREGVILERTTIFPGGDSERKWIFRYEISPSGNPALNKQPRETREEKGD